MASIDNFQQVKMKIDELAQIKDILNCFSNAKGVNIRFSYVEQPDASFRLDSAMRTTIKTKYEAMAAQLWTEIQQLTADTTSTTGTTTDTTTGTT